MMNYTKKAVLISCFGNWYRNRLEPIKCFFEKNGYQVRVFLSDFDHQSKTYIEEKSSMCEYVHVPKYAKNLSVARIYSHITFGRNVYKKISTAKPDFIYLLLPPNYTASRCLKYIKKNPKTKYVVDLIDLWPESMPIEKFKFTISYQIWTYLRNESLKKADLVITECDLYQQKLKDIISNKKTGVLPLFRRLSSEEKEMIDTILATYKAQEEEICIAYLGSINHIIDLMSIIQVIKVLKSKYKKVNLHIIGDGETRKQFVKEASEAGANVVFHGKIFDEDEKISILSACDFGLNMMKSNIAVGLTIKSVDYFSKGLPIINNIKGDTWKLVENEGLGINYCGNPASLLRALHDCDITKMKKRAFKIFQKQFTEEAFSNNIIDLLEGLL